ncbi:protein of unknown function DUF4283 [Macleaya cordata]|uniref:DUF4283 domain-containing protein n=1 Tax=Macleaya cordata TaxID=56857 RepID=A0A200R0J5_MACCD|nr:protein of unknown function DUF4283 [Macleaya cordata]
MPTPPPPSSLSHDHTKPQLDPDEVIKLMASLMHDELRTPTIQFSAAESLPSSDWRKSLVVKLPQNRNLPIGILRELLQTAWNPTTTMPIKEFYEGSYLVHFKELADLDAVIIGAPWTIHDDLLLYERCENNKLPEEYTFEKAKFWVQLHGLLVDYLTPASVFKIASELGPAQPIKSEDTMKWGRYARAKIELDITDALPKHINTTLANGKPCRVDLKYEKLARFCYFCGIVGHLG